MSVSDISTFFTKSTRSKNDATNKVRENVLKIISNPPKEYLENIEYGSSWKTVHQAWNDALKKIGPDYTSIQTKMKGGRAFHYDVDVIYYNGTNQVATKKIEFKNGGEKIGNLPQFLSLQAKIDLFPETYDKFWYENYIDRYLAVDPAITEAKPELDEYLKLVTKTTYSIHPFIEQLKARELFLQREKNAVVNKSISDYLSKHGPSINITAFSEKVKATQQDKIYLLWHKGQFHLDKMTESEMSEMSFHSIKNGNVLQLKTGNTLYGLLLRWRNHKGILNPAWQITMKRLL